MLAQSHRRELYDLGIPHCQQDPDKRAKGRLLVGCDDTGVCYVDLDLDWYAMGTNTRTTLPRQSTLFIIAIGLLTTEGQRLLSNT